MIQSRRGFITGLAALIAAPAIVKAGSLMPIKSFKPVWILPEYAGPFSAQADVAYGILRVGDIIRMSHYLMGFSVWDDPDFMAVQSPVEDYKEFLITGTNTIVALSDRQ